MLSVWEVLQLDPYLFLGKGNEDTGDEVLHEQYVILPQVETNKIYYYIPTLAYYLMVCAIPYGKVSTEEEIWDKLKSVYGIEKLDFSQILDDTLEYERSKEETDPYRRPGQKKQGRENKNKARRHDDWQPRNNRRDGKPRAPKKHTPGRDHRKLQIK